MASRKFRFVSPGVFLKEIDRSQIPGTPENVGPVIIGRTRKGPSMRPYKIKSMDEFERVFGAMVPGNQGEDPWRDGTDLLSEAYAPYAAKAYLSADIDSPVTVVRLAGVAGDDAIAGGAGEPGWKASNAYGLFLIPSSSGASGEATATNDLPLTGTLAAIFYGAASTEFTASLYGRDLVTDPNTGAGGSIQALTGAVIMSEGPAKFAVKLDDNSGNNKTVNFNFPNIRKEFNTNPVATNECIACSYF